MMKLPKDLLFIPLKYAGHCRSCATRLEAGERAHWSPSSKGVWCVDCTTGKDSSVQSPSDHGLGGSQNTATNASPRGSSNAKASTNSSPTPWQRLCTYAQRCIEAEAAKSLVPVRQEKTHYGSHTLETKYWSSGRAIRRQRPENYPKKLRSRTGSIIYGWPTVVVIDRDHMPKVDSLICRPG